MADYEMSDVEFESDFSEEEDFFDDDDMENAAPTAKKVKSAAPKSSGTSKVLSSTSSNAASKTVEELYQKKTQLEHILIRPDTYIGSVERHKQSMFVLDGDKIVEREVEFTPGLYKIFDEIVVNAADNKQRSPEMNEICIDIDAEANMVSVKNNGKGIPVVMHKEYKVYVPTLIFGQLLTGSNFDDDEKKTTGGRNGYGAKLANVFSTEFVVECVDTENKLHFTQTFRDNMSVKEEPKVRKCTAKELKDGDFVKISFSPDLPRFRMDSLDDDIVGLFGKRAYDIAGTMTHAAGKKLYVKLNGNKLPIKSFEDYLGCFEGINKPVAYEKFDRWEIGVAPTDDQTMKQVSFVNSICTYKGGKHVDYIADQIANHLVKVIKKKNKGGSEVKKNQISNHLCIFVNCLVENPTFDSQTKDFLTTKSKDFGSTCTVSAQFLKKVEKSEIVKNILDYTAFKDRKALKNKGGKKQKKLIIPKLDDANFAGTAKSKDCTLIITEGDSAKSLAVAGLSVVGRDYYGVFPLRGKPMNVRDATIKQVTTNEEIKNVVDILGLKYDQQYDETSIKNLRYGHLMIMADQDSDGSHIKGLVINFLHHFWPSLLNVEGFLQQFITPIVKATKGKKTKSFFSIPEFQEWLNGAGNQGKGYTIKYYKGLGTSTSAEAKDYFSNLQLHEVHFDTLDDDVTEENTPYGSDVIDMAFRKTRVEDRKTWLNTMSESHIDYSIVPSNGIKYSEFFNREYILFSKYDNVRSIPNFMDGFKPSQRKVLFGCFKRKLKGEVKVAQLTGYVAEHSAYHHGEQSLQGTIVNMAQNFCGSNNINLLTPSGQFGTRRLGGKDAASARYIFTKLEPITRKIFHPDDDELLDYYTEDSQKIEPKFYVPVIPMVLVNGSDGIGTGWSSNVNNYNPRDIIKNLRHLIAGEEIEEMMPYYEGYTGEIKEKKTKGSYTVRGKIERIDDTTLEITELPLKKWTHDYKTMLEGMMIGDEKKKIMPEIKEFRENHTETTVAFTVIADKEKIDEFEKEKDGLYGKFKLLGSLSSSNMTLFDENETIKKFETTEEIMKQFFEIRLDYYERRKALLVSKLESEQKILSNKARFISEVCSGELVVSNRKRSEILEDLQERGYDIYPKNDKSSSGEDESDSEEQTDSSDVAHGYDYLLSMKIWSLTFEKAEALRQQLEEKTLELEELVNTDPKDIWVRDLDEIEQALDERDVANNEALADEKQARKKAQKQSKAIRKKTSKKKDEWDSDMESSDEDDGMESDGMDVSPVGKKAAPPKKKPAPPKAKPTVPVAKATVPVAKPVIKKKAAPKVESPAKEDSDDDDFLGKSLLERMRTKLVVSPPAKKVEPKKPAAARAKSSLDFDSESEASLDLLDADDFVAASVTPAKPKAATKKPAAAKAAASKKPAPAKKSVLEVDSDSDDLEFGADESAPARARTGRAAAKKVVYELSDDEDDESSYFSESD